MDIMNRVKSFFPLLGRVGGFVSCRAHIYPTRSAISRHITVRLEGHDWERVHVWETVVAILIFVYLHLFSRLQLNLTDVFGGNAVLLRRFTFCFFVLYAQRFHDGRGLGERIECVRVSRKARTHVGWDACGCTSTFYERAGVIYKIFFDYVLDLPTTRVACVPDLRIVHLCTRASSSHDPSGTAATRVLKRTPRWVGRGWVVYWHYVLQQQYFFIGVLAFGW